MDSNTVCPICGKTQKTNNTQKKALINLAKATGFSARSIDDEWDEPTQEIGVVGFYENWEKKEYTLPWF